MNEIVRRGVAVYSIVVVFSLLLGSFVSLADHQQQPGHRTSWAKYEGGDGFMKVEEHEYDSNGRYFAWVFQRVPPGAYDYHCEDERWTNRASLRDDDGWEYFQEQCDSRDQLSAPFNIDNEGNSVDVFYECVMIVGYVDVGEIGDEGNGGAGTYEWDTTIKIYVDHGHYSYDDSIRIGCGEEEEDDGVSLLFILGAVVVTGSLIGAAFLYAKRVATGVVGAVAETSSQDQQKANQSREKSREDVNSPKNLFWLIDGEATSMSCPNCGLHNDVKGKFCMDCGTNLSQEWPT